MYTHTYVSKHGNTSIKGPHIFRYWHQKCWEHRREAARLLKIFKMSHCCTCIHSVQCYTLYILHSTILAFYILYITDVSFLLFCCKSVTPLYFIHTIWVFRRCILQCILQLHVCTVQCRCCTCCCALLQCDTAWWFWYVLDQNAKCSALRDYWM